jgi:Zn-dependent peptidase ImmA (M78 family)
MLDINLLGRRIPVRFVSDKELDQIGKDKNLQGLYDVSTNTIYLSTSLNQETSRRVLLHEATHAVLSIAGLESLLKNKQEEAVCTAMESLVDIFKNPDLVKFLAEVEE